MFFDVVLRPLYPQLTVVKTWLINAVMRTTQAVVKLKPEKIQAWMAWIFIFQAYWFHDCADQSWTAILPYHVFFSPVFNKNLFTAFTEGNLKAKKKILLSYFLLRQQFNQYSTTEDRVRLKVFRQVTCKLKSWRIFTSESLRPGIFIPSGILCEKTYEKLQNTTLKTGVTFVTALL